MAVTGDFEKGDKVFVDSFAGLVPGIVTEPGDRGTVKVRLTATRGAYRRGETSDFPVRSVVKREWVHTRSGQYVIVEPRRSNPWQRFSNPLGRQ